MFVTNIEDVIRLAPTAGRGAVLSKGLLKLCVQLLSRESIADVFFPKGAPDAGVDAEHLRHGVDIRTPSLKMRPFFCLKFHFCQCSVTVSVTISGATVSPAIRSLLRCCNGRFRSHDPNWRLPALY